MGTRQKLCDIRDHLEPVKDLGVWIDPKLTMNEHVKNLCRSCFYQLRQIRCIKKYLTKESLITLIHSFICNRIDYCNSVLYGISSYLLDYVQSILNTAAGVSRYTSISSFIRHELHWLPVCHRICYKIAILTRDCMMGVGPLYLQKLIVPASSVAGERKLRSATKKKVIVPKFKRENYRGRRFSVAAARVWNELPDDVVNVMEDRLKFWKRLKHHYYNLQQLDQRLWVQHRESLYKLTIQYNAIYEYSLE